MSASYGRLVRVVRFLLRRFFREVVVTGLENVPRDGGGVLVAWHPNGLIDPALILATLPGTVVFGARDGLFKWPVLGRVMRAVGTVPIYRARDASGGDERDRSAANRESLATLARVVAEGSFSTLFPEGHSHDQPYLTELKTGAASLYFRALDQAGGEGPLPVIMPVGLHYEHKRLVGSRVIVSSHPPLDLSGDLAAPIPAEAPKEERRSRYRRVTEKIEAALRAVVLSTESWDLHNLMQRGRKLVRAERGHRAGVRLGRPEMEEKVLGFARLWVGYETLLREAPQRVEAMIERVREYDKSLRALGLEDHQLDPAARLGSWWTPLWIVGLVILVYLAGPTVIMMSLFVNLPVALLLWGVAKVAAKQRKDEATVKLLVGSVAFPLAWLIAALMVYWGVARFGAQSDLPDELPLVAAALVPLVGAGGAVLALYYRRLAAETAHLLRVRITRRRQAETVERLLAERSELCDLLVGAGAGVDLPGRVTDEGRVASAVRPDDPAAPHEGG